MKTNRDIRAEARQILKNGWFGRLSTVGLALYTLLFLATLALTAAFASCEIKTWTGFWQSKIQAIQGGLDLAVPSAAIAWSMTGATLFQQLVGWLLGAIVLFGLATVLLKAVRNETTRWFADSFGGFARPFEVLWLIVLMNLRIFLWSLLFVLPGFIALYRYRQAWYVKSEHPDWSAGACLAESGRLMKGRKMQAMWMDGFFLLWMLFAYLVTAAGAGLGWGATSILGALVGGLVSAFVGFGVVYLWVFVFVYALMARAVFYREVKSACPAVS